MYSAEQLEAIRQAQQILQQAGLQPKDILGDEHSPENTFPIRFLINYTSPEVTLFTLEEIEAQKNRLTRKSYIHGIVDHPIGAIHEYPETGHQPNVAIAHRYEVDPNFVVLPRPNLQYSFGEPKSVHHNVNCFQLLDQVTGEPVKCEQTKLTCRSIKTCSFNPGDLQSHQPVMPLDAAGELFIKTLGFFCALQEVGCAFDKTTCHFVDDNESDSDSDSENDAPAENSGFKLVAILKDIRSHQDDQKTTCKGNLLLQKDKFNHFFIRCEHFAKGRRNHLALRNLKEYDIGYLQALFQNDIDKITSYEVSAANKGYGPLYPCNVTAAAREQKQLCPIWHRIDGVLQRGKIEIKDIDKCDCRMEIYEPNDLSRCPYILVVFRNPHSHVNPPRSRTPKGIELIFNSLLQHLEWRLADATPRRILLDNMFMYGLRKILNWNEIQDPGLGDLHPSLINYDHAARLINDMRYGHYPKGTGLKGANHLLENHQKLPPDQQYLRCIKTCENPKDGKFHIVICMFKAMSHLFVKMRRPSIDTAFKRLDKWQEFEIEAWFPEFSRSVVVVRAFTTSQSAEAHQILFRLIFQIVENDTGQKVQFRHIHGCGIDTITADGHEGQALGLGLYLQEICQEEAMMEAWSVEWDKKLCELTPREHLMCIYIYCFTHFTRNVANLRGHVKPNVIAAMMSLASSDDLPNFDEVVKTIRDGGPKARKWYKNKEKGDGVPLAAIYRPKSKIPLEIWKAAPSTSNGNEQAHRNINRDGTKLTMLAGIMRGLQFDSRAMGNIEYWMAESIQSRDKLATHFRRSARGVRTKTYIQQRNVLSKDVEILTVYEKAQKLQMTIVTDAAAVEQALESAAEEVDRAPKRRRKNDEKEQPSELERAQKRLRDHDEQLTDLKTQLDSLLPQGSGSYALAKLQKPEELYDRMLLDAKPKKKTAPKSEKGSNSHTTPKNPTQVTDREHLPVHASYAHHGLSQGLPLQNVYRIGNQSQTASQSQNVLQVPSQSQHVFRVAPQPQNPFPNTSQPINPFHNTYQPTTLYPIASQPQNVHYIRGSQPQSTYYNNPQSTTEFYNNYPQPSSVHQYGFTHSQNIIHASHFVHPTQNSNLAAYSGPAHAHPPTHDAPLIQPRYHHPGYYSQQDSHYY